MDLAVKAAGRIFFPCMYLLKPQGLNHHIHRTLFGLVYILVQKHNLCTNVNTFVVKKALIQLQVRSINR